jgi:hypothetical protein
VINDHVEKILLGLFCEPPKQVSPSSMPYAIVDFLNGKDFERKASQGFPSLHCRRRWLAARGDAEPRRNAGARCIRGRYQSSNTSRNPARDGRLTLTLPLDHGLCVMHLRATAEKQRQYRYFTAVVEDTRRLVRFLSGRETRDAQRNQPPRRRDQSARLDLPALKNGRRPWLRFTCARIYIKEKKMTNDKIFFRIVKWSISRASSQRLAPR